MAEFLPDDMQTYVLRQDLGPVDTLRADLERICDAASDLVPAITAHCRETLAPRRFAETLGDRYDARLKEKRGKKSYASARKDARVEDVTILIPCYKPDAAFRETVDSICAQTTGIPSVLLCADGTPDDRRIFLEYALARLPDLKIIEQRNAGLLAARNALIEQCGTSLSVFLDVDDLLAPEFLERGLEAYNNSLECPDAVLFQRQTFYEDGVPVLHTTMDDHIHVIENEFRMTALIKTDVLREIGFPSDRRNGEADDWTFWLDFSLSDYRSVFVPETLFWYRFHRNSMSWPWSEGQHVGSMAMIKDVLMKHADYNPDIARYMAQAMFAKSVRW